MMQIFSNLFTLGTAFAALVIFVLYYLGLFIYRAFFDSLSHIPGPKIAAATLWYEFYYDVIKKGRYTWEIAKMHEKYGPIVRINPYEVHINDPEYIDEVYPGSQVRTFKYPWAVAEFGLNVAGFATEGHELHRIRRGATGHYFSKSSLVRLEPGIQSVIDNMLSKLRGLQGTGKVTNLLDLYACVTVDIISQYAYAKSFGFLEDPKFHPEWHHMLMDVSQNGHLVKQCPWMLPLMMGMPLWLVKLSNPLMYSLIMFQEGYKQQVRDVKAELAAGREPKGQTSIFYEILTNPEIRPEEKQDEFLWEEAQTIISAGTVTTTHILSFLTFHIVSNPAVLAKLQAELSTIITPSNPSPKWQQLEKLPYLTAIINEGLRIGYGVSHRLQRRFPDRILQYDKYSVPALTPVSMTAVLIHNEPELFPEPRTFNPDRFVKNPGLKKYLLSFSKGTRQCLGITLAYAELYLTLAAVFAPGRFRIQLFETDISDVEVVHDFLNVSPRLDSKGIRVTVEDVKA